METSKKPPLKPVTIARTPSEIKTMKVINIAVISLVAVFVVIIIGCALNGMDEMAAWLGGGILIVLWNYRVIRRKYARGL